MRYLATGFNLTIGGMRLRLQIDLDDVEDPGAGGEAYGAHREDAACEVGTFDHGPHAGSRPPHHLRSRRT